MPEGRARRATGSGGASRGGGRRAAAGSDAVRRDSRPGRPDARARNDVAQVAVPDLPEEAQADLLEPAVRDAVAGLGGPLAHFVGRHLAAAGLFLDRDPERALAHAKAAKSKAPRLAQAREILGISAYAAGDFALARSELRAARRITGTVDLLPMLADCERGLGHPERALAVAAEPDARRLGPDERIELAIVVAGARRDLGEYRAAVQTLTLPALKTDNPNPTTIRLWYAYADALVSAGRQDEASRYFEKVVRADAEETTDAVLRLTELAAIP